MLKNIILSIVLLALLATGCSTQQTAESKTETPLQEVQQSTLPKDVTQSFYDDAIKISTMIHAKVKDELPLSEDEIKQIVTFSEKYPNLTDTETNIHDTIVILAEANSKYVTAKLQGDIVKQDNQSKEIAFQKAKLQEWSILK